MTRIYSSDRRIEFENEDEARVAVERLLRSHYHVIPEVQLKHWSGKRLRIDYVAVPRTEDARQGLIGVEVKRGYYDKHGDLEVKSVTRTIQQAIDYSQARIVDKRARHSSGKRLDFVLLFPKPPVDYAAGFLLWRLAGRFRVGYIAQSKWGTDFRVSETKLWSSEWGAADAKLFSAPVRVGSQ